MPTRLEIFDKVKESDVIVFFKEFGDDAAKYVTAVNDNQGTFSIEATFVDPPAAGGAGGVTIKLEGKMSTFGGPGDPGVKPDEGLSLFDTPEDAAANPDLFLPAQPPGTTGLAKRLNPDAKYLACRWDLTVTPKSFLRTITVKVTNPANGRTVAARPADTGPAAFTGRVADLSLSLANALGLQTDQKCVVEIPTPGGTAEPAPPDADAEGIVLTDIDPVFGPDKLHTVSVATVADQIVYWVVNKIGDDDAGQSLFRRAGNRTEVLLTDTTVFPIQTSDKIPADVANELNKAMEKSGPVEQGGNPPQPGDDINAKMFAAAQGFKNHATKDVPNTKNGTLACAWAVNQVTRIALGKPISADDQGRNGLTTDGIFAVLKAHHTRLNSASDAVPGTIIIAPSTPATHGHVGIVGAAAGSADGTAVVFSNSTKDRQFEQNYTIKRFTNAFRGLGLDVLFFALKADQF